MTSPLFRLAAQRARDLAARTRARRNAVNRVGTPVQRALSAGSTDTGPMSINSQPEQYRLRQRIANTLRQILGAFGFPTNVQPRPGQTADQALEDLAGTIQALGGDSTGDSPGSVNSDERRQQQAQDALDLIMGGSGQGPPAPPVATGGQDPGDDRPREISTQMEPTARAPLSPPTPAEARQEWSEVENVSARSSNVWSFQYHFPSSTLVVTFKAPDLNPKSVGIQRGKGGLKGIVGIPGQTVVGSRNEPGPVYHYFDVPVRVYRRMIRRSSPGGAVWDELRVRGTIFGHQYRYSLASPGITPIGGGQRGAYTPRRATPRGFRSRSVAEVGVGRRQFLTSSLPEQTVDRGLPDRGEPDRGF